MAGLYIDGDLWWASTSVTNAAGSSVIGKHFTANHYDYTYVYTWDYATANGTNLNGIICPDGWRLPTNNEVVALLKLSGFATASGIDQYTSAGYHANINGTGKNGRWFGPGVFAGGDDASKYPYTTDTHIFLPYAGSGASYTANNVLSTTLVGIRGDIWSSSLHSPYARRTELHITRIRPQVTLSGVYSYSIRCVADPL